MRISLGFVLISVSQLLAQSTPKEALLVLSKGNHTLAIVDPVSLKVIATAPSGPDPHEVIATADGKLAFISNYGFGEYNTLSVMDLITQKALPAVDLGPLRGPHGLQVVGGKVWFTAEAAKVIGSYDPVAKKVDWVLGTGQNRTHMLIVSQDMQRIVTANVSSGTMSIIEKTEVRMGPPPGAPPNGGGGSGGPPPGMRQRKDWDEIVVKVGNGPEPVEIYTGWEACSDFDIGRAGCDRSGRRDAPRGEADTGGAGRSGNPDAARWVAGICGLHAG